MFDRGPGPPSDGAGMPGIIGGMLIVPGPIMPMPPPLPAPLFPLFPRRLSLLNGSANVGGFGGTGNPSDGGGAPCGIERGCGLGNVFGIAGCVLAWRGCCCCGCECDKGCASGDVTGTGDARWLLARRTPSTLENGSTAGEPRIILGDVELEPSRSAPLGGPLPPPLELVGLSAAPEQTDEVGELRTWASTR